MKMNKNGLDEMQKEKRNHIGNQMFLWMFYALLFDCGLHGAGIYWLKYPANILVIIMVFMIIYLIRTIAANAYLPPREQSGRTMLWGIVAIVFSIILAIVSFHLFKNIPLQPSADDGNDHSALILFIISASGLLISLLVAVIRKVNNKKNDDD